MFQSIVRTYARAFLSQSVGIVGLLWCLFDGHVGIGLLLGLLVLADQAMFLNRRFGRDVHKSALETAIDVWCIGVGLIDIVLIFAVQLRDAPLRDRLTGAALVDPSNALAYSLATFFRLGSDLLPGDPTTRLLVEVEALLGTATLLAVAIALVLWIGARLRRPSA